MPMKGDEPKPTVSSILTKGVGTKPVKDLRFNYVFVRVAASAMAEALAADTGGMRCFGITRSLSGKRRRFWRS